MARTSLRTKLPGELADQLTDIVTDAVLIVRRDGEPIDLHMVERMHMLHRCVAQQQRCYDSTTQDNIRRCCTLTSPQDRQGKPTRARPRARPRFAAP